MKLSYETDNSHAHREYWRSLLLEAREELEAPAADTLTFEELDALTRPEATI